MLTNYDMLYEGSSYNKEQVIKAHTCGCFFCKKIFLSTEIQRWEFNRYGVTALCPYCEKDAIVPESESGEYELSQSLLEEMHIRYFPESSDVSIAVLEELRNAVRCEIENTQDMDVRARKLDKYSRYKAALAAKKCENK